MRLLAFLSLLACSTISCTTTTRLGTVSETWPTLVQPMNPSAVDEGLISRLTKSHAKPSAVWIDTGDVNGDMREDAMVTVELTEGAGARGRLITHTTLMLVGTQQRHHVVELQSATLWFSLPTLSYLIHAKYPDVKIRRQFSVFRKDGSWHIHVHETKYTNSAGDGTTRGFMLKRQTQSLLWKNSPSGNPSWHKNKNIRFSA